ncbi:ParB/RepB/Spo0J family partition protein [Pseudoalteromonas luteoviolacea]|uniref:ParB/RepB/Spo0J family partition protein n=1 Tax=Pseudoalteromonas luteoviolacea TaxID=43657 RepID=UPI0011524662|nr:ParB/RepB/Spo0J family partition protein [Pseudoalteromonas luteoviolacea]TQF66184.1 ParB/RepB/Spo0J family partition protein [Pseudoalteromonas luteoviolacea]
MKKRSNNASSLFDKLKANSPEAAKPAYEAKNEKAVVNPVVGLAIGERKVPASSEQIAILKLTHDQIRLFKYHDRHTASLNTEDFEKLKNSIKNNGQHTPGFVRKTKDTTEDGRVIYELVSGRMRFEATRELNVFKAFLLKLDDTQAVELMLSENAERRNITPFERYMSIVPILKDGIMKQVELAAKIEWDKGNLSKAAKSIDFYLNLKLERFIDDPHKVKLNTFLSLHQLYVSQPEITAVTIDDIAESKPNLKNGAFFQAVSKAAKKVVEPNESKSQQKHVVSLPGCKATIDSKNGQFSISFSALPSFDDLTKLANSLKKSGNLKPNVE